MVDYRQIATQAAQTYGIPVDTFLSLLGAESSWNPNALSPKGAIGLGQLMPATAKELGVDPYDPEQNIYGSAKYLAQQFKRFGDPALAVAAYNAGPSAVAKYGGIPPYEETQNYVARVMGTQMADQVTPQQMAPQQAAGYQQFGPENLSRSQRTMLGFAALRDAAAALRGNQTSFFSDAYSGLEQRHRYGQELAFRQAQEQRLIDERAAAARQNATQAQLRAAEALAQVRQQLQWSPNDPTLLALEQSLMAQALGPSGMMPAAAAPAGASAGMVPAAGAEPAAPPVSLPAAVTAANDPSKLDDAQLSAAMATLSTSNDPKAVEALKVLRGEAATRAAAQEKSGPDIENYRSAQTLITEISSNPALSGVLGRFEGGIEAGVYFSEKENALLAQIEQIRGKAFLDAFEKLKGGGPITDTEGRAATNAVTRIQNRFTDVAEYKKALEELRQVFANAEARATGKPVPYPSIGAANAQNPAGVSQEAFEFFSVSPEGQ